MKRENSKGPSTEPWGTPDLIKLKEEKTSLWKTACCLSLRYDLINWAAELEKLNLYTNFLTSFECDTRSKAFAKSIRSKIAIPLLSITRDISSCTFISAVFVLWLVRNPDWWGCNRSWSDINFVIWFLISFSNTFDMEGRILIGRKLEIDEQLPFFLIGIILEFFQARGKVEVSMITSNKCL